MSDIQIELVTKTITQPEGKKYKQMEVIYKNLSFQGKVENKKIIDFYAKDIWPVLEDANQGDVFTIKREKEGEYWTWKGITSGKAQNNSQGTTSSSAGGTTGARTYVADDVKQRMIVRQNCVGNAVKYLENTEKTTVERVLEVASQFESYVYALPEPIKIDFSKVGKATLPAELDDDLDDLPC